MNNCIERKLNIKFTVHHLEKILRRFNINNETVIQLNGFENFVFLFKKYNKEFILRITHSSHRNEEYIWGEINWIDDLASRKIAVAQPVSLNGKKLVEVFKFENGDYFCVIFEKASGREVTIEDWKHELFYIWGKVAGKMHRITKSYSNEINFLHRPKWHEEKYLNPNKYLPPSQNKIIKRYHNLIEEIKNFPLDEKSYGLIHADLHTSNFFLNKKNITVFDFDDSIYSWYIHDIAIILFSALQKNQEFYNRKELPELFWRNFWHGYSSENHLDLYWLKRLPYFYKLREMQIYVNLHRSFDVEKLNSWESDFIKFTKNISSQGNETYYNIEKEYLLLNHQN